MTECLDSMVFVSMIYNEISFGNAKKNGIDICLFTDSNLLIDEIKSNKHVACQ